VSQPYLKAGYTLSNVTARIIAAGLEVHQTPGPGFEEVIYQRALARELPAHDLEFSREVWIDVYYKGVY
jgi:GxxExxY protein